ncbi:MAG TPA: hypothetical protein VK179_00190 [Bacteroidales bacterium]|nr:hypothetical protein [Bacteroidales bacterium]
MKSSLKKIAGFFLVALLVTATSYSQQAKQSENQKKKEKVERSYKKAYAKARKKTIKHRREIQTDDTKKRMDAADKRAEAYNRQNDPGFFERIFRKKRPGKR